MYDGYRASVSYPNKQKDSESPQAVRGKDMARSVVLFRLLPNQIPQVDVTCGGIME